MLVCPDCFVNASHAVSLNSECVTEFICIFSLFLSGHTSRTSKSRDSSAKNLSQKEKRCVIAYNAG
jgi:hypothetical protein